MEVSVKESYDVTRWFSRTLTKCDHIRQSIAIKAKWKEIISRIQLIYLRKHFNLCLEQYLLLFNRIKYRNRWIEFIKELIESDKQNNFYFILNNHRRNHMISKEGEIKYLKRENWKRFIIHYLHQTQYHYLNTAKSRLNQLRKLVTDKHKSCEILDGKETQKSDWLFLSHCLIHQHNLQNVAKLYQTYISMKYKTESQMKTFYRKASTYLLRKNRIIIMIKVSRAVSTMQNFIRYALMNLRIKNKMDYSQFYPNIELLNNFAKECVESSCRKSISKIKKMVMDSNIINIRYQSTIISTSMRSTVSLFAIKHIEVSRLLFERRVHFDIKMIIPRNRKVCRKRKIENKQEIQNEDIPIQNDHENSEVSYYSTSSDSSRLCRMFTDNSTDHFEYKQQSITPSEIFIFDEHSKSSISDFDIPESFNSQELGYLVRDSDKAINTESDPKIDSSEASLVRLFDDYSLDSASAMILNASDGEVQI